MKINIQFLALVLTLISYSIFGQTSQNKTTDLKNQKSKTLNDLIKYLDTDEYHYRSTATDKENSEHKTITQISRSKTQFQKEINNVVNKYDFDFNEIEKEFEAIDEEFNKITQDNVYNINEKDKILKYAEAALQNNSLPTANEWDKVKQLIEALDIYDKDIYLRVLSTCSDSTEFNKLLKYILQTSKTYSNNRKTGSIQ